MIKWRSEKKHFCEVKVEGIVATIGVDMGEIRVELVSNFISIEEAIELDTALVQAITRAKEQESQDE